MIEKSYFLCAEMPQIWLGRDDSIDGAVEVREKIAAGEREKYQKEAPISHDLLRGLLNSATALSQHSLDLPGNRLPPSVWHGDRTCSQVYSTLRDGSLRDIRWTRLGCRPSAANGFAGHDVVNGQGAGVETYGLQLPMNASAKRPARTSAVKNCSTRSELA